MSRRAWGLGLGAWLAASACVQSRLTYLGEQGADGGSPQARAVGPFEGFGAAAKGGAGRPAVAVTSLEDSGAGTLRTALGRDRVIKFEVSGTINLESDLEISGARLTLDGFSAPAPGITLSGAQLVILGNSDGEDETGSDILIQGLRFRSPGAGRDAIQIGYNAHDVVVDHVTIGGAVGDGAIDITEGAHDITVSYSVLDYSSSPGGPGASLVAYDASRISFHHNIFFGAPSSNPELVCDYARAYSKGPPLTGILADVRYNVIWGYGMGTYLLSSTNAAGTCVGQANIVSNLYQSNGSTNPADVIVRSNFDGAPRADAYVAGNAAVHDPRGCAYPYNSGPCFPFEATNSQNNQSSPFAAPAVAGPEATDQAGRLAEWQRVKAGAGVISQYPDDDSASAVRAALAIPSLTIFSQPWND